MFDKARESLKIIDQELNYRTVDDEGYSCGLVDMGYNFCREEINTISQALDHADKLEETIKLIVKKVMPLVSLQDSETGICVNGRFAVYDSEYYQSNDLTKTEFNQIKEMIEKYGK